MDCCQATLKCFWKFSSCTTIVASGLFKIKYAATAPHIYLISVLVKRPQYKDRKRERQVDTQDNERWSAHWQGWPCSEYTHTHTHLHTRTHTDVTLQWHTGLQHVPQNCFLSRWSVCVHFCAGVSICVCACVFDLDSQVDIAAKFWLRDKRPL